MPHFDIHRNSNNFSYCIARLMEQYGFSLSEHIYFLFSCGLWLNVKPGGLAFGNGSGGGSWVETDNPYRCEYLSSAFGCPYQYRTIDGKNALAWVAGRMERKDPLLLEVPETILKVDEQSQSGTAKTLYALVKSMHETGPLTDDTEIQLHFSALLQKTFSYQELNKYITRHPEVKAIMYFAPLKIEPDAFMKEMIVQSIIKQYYILRSCFCHPREHGFESLKHALLEEKDSHSALKEHFHLLKGLNYDVLVEEYPSLNREYYAHSLEEAAHEYKIDLSGWINAFHHNAEIWNHIMSEVKMMNEPSFKNMINLYDTIGSNEDRLLSMCESMIGKWNYS